MSARRPPADELPSRPDDGAADTAGSPSAGAPGLVLVAGENDSLETLYAKVYRGLKPPPYPAVVGLNRMPVKPGDLVIFPRPPDGWSARTD